MFSEIRVAISPKGYEHSVGKSALISQNSRPATLKGTIPFLIALGLAELIYS